MKNQLVRIIETGEVVRVKKNYGGVVLSFWVNEPFYIFGNILVKSAIISAEKVEFFKPI